MTFASLRYNMNQRRFKPARGPKLVYRLARPLPILSLFLVVVLNQSGCKKYEDATLGEIHHSDTSTVLVQAEKQLAAQKCLESVRGKMKNNQFRFELEKTHELDQDINRINSALFDAIQKNIYKEKKFQFGKKINSNIPNWIGIEQIGQIEKTKFVYEQSLSPADETLQHGFLTLNISVLETNVQSDSNLPEMFRFNQVLNISDDCEFKLSATSRSQAIPGKTSDKKNFHFKKLTLYPDGREGSRQESSKIVVAPENSDYSEIVLRDLPENFSQSKTALETWKDHPLIAVSDQFGSFNQLIYKKESQVKVMNFLTKKEESYRGFEFENTQLTENKASSTKTNINVLFSADDKTKITRSSKMNSETYTVQAGTWESINPGASIQINSRKWNALPTIKSDASSILAEVKSSKPLIYENLGQYWQIGQLAPVNNDVPFMFSFQMRSRIISESDFAKSLPLVEEKLRPENPYLQATDRIDPQDPHIEKLISDNLILKSNPSRQEIAIRILQALKQVLVYDNTSLNKGSIYPLKTADIFLRRQGVCQHFANLFAAIARAVGLPVKIVEGFHSAKDHTYGAHAWNEIEVQKDIWLPIEPQSTSLTFDTRNYIPISEAYSLEYEYSDFDLVLKEMPILDLDINVLLKPDLVR
jgi:transglutaminase-like putative cysteine protease